MVKPEAKRKAVESFGQSMRRLCVLIGLSRSSWNYKPKPDSNESISVIGLKSFPMSVDALVIVDCITC